MPHTPNLQAPPFSGTTLDVILQNFLHVPSIQTISANERIKRFFYMIWNNETAKLTCNKY